MSEYATIRDATLAIVRRMGRQAAEGEYVDVEELDELYRRVAMLDDPSMTASLRAENARLYEAMKDALACYWLSENKAQEIGALCALEVALSNADLVAFDDWREDVARLRDDLACATHFVVPRGSGCLPDHNWVGVDAGGIWWAHRVRGGHAAGGERCASREEALALARQWAGEEETP